MTRDRTHNEKPDRRPEGLAKPATRPLSPDLQAHIGVRLKAYYDSVLSEPIPDRFAQLLDQLDAASEKDGADKARTGASDGDDPDQSASAMSDANGDVRS